MPWLKKASVDHLLGGDPKKLMPRLKQIHKLSEFPVGEGPEDWGARNKERSAKTKEAAGTLALQTSSLSPLQDSSIGLGRMGLPSDAVPPGESMENLLRAIAIMREAEREVAAKNEKLLKQGSLVKCAEPPPPEGVSAEEWDKILQGKKPNKLDKVKKAAAVLKTELLPQQQRVLGRISNQRGLVVAHGLGSGKTLSSIAAAISVQPDRTQVLVPASLQDNYRKEIRKHVSGRLPIEIGSLQNAAAKGLIPRSDLLVVDEAHRARNPQSKTYQMLQGAQAGKRLLLTASPTYNRPADVASVVNLAAGEKVLPLGGEFNKKFIARPATGLMSLLPVTRKQPGLKNTPELKKALSTWVDYHKAEGGNFPDVSQERIAVPMTKRQTQLHDASWGKLSLLSKIRLQRGLPPRKEDLPKINAFQSQSRQIASTEAPFSTGKVDVSPKIQRAVDEFWGSAVQNPQHRALVYSNYLGSLGDYSNALTEKGAPHAVFSGQKPMAERKQMVRDYNSGKLKALLVSSAGGEGLDLKGTRQVQLLEPHWNEEKLKQVAGRAIRQGSHAHLPPDERKVAVQRFESYPLGGWFKKRRGVEQVLNDMADNKERLNQELTNLLEKRGYTLQGHKDVQGLNVAIENRKGGVRKGKDKDGKEWRTKMKHPYGYLVGTKGADGDPVDAYVGPDEEAGKAYVVHQHKVDGTGYDEDKVMLGFKSKKEAKEGYLKHYDDPKFLGPISTVTIDRLKALVESKKKLVKISSVRDQACLEELNKLAGAPQAVQKREAVKAIRKSGPGIGGATGAAVGALVGLKRGRLLQSTMAGLGTGATLGWTPDMYLSAKEAIKRYRRKVK